MNIGFLGTGHITYSIILGIFKSKLKIKKIYISPRNKNIAKKLSKRFKKVAIAKDNQQLIETLFRLRDLGNTVIVVEHDEDAIRQSDHIIDIGPEAGLKGGQIVAEGEVKEIINNEKSITGNYLSGRKFIPVPKKRRTAKNGRFIEISGASGNNLKKVNLKNLL